MTRQAITHPRIEEIAAWLLQAARNERAHGRSRLAQMEGTR
ncbi:hypothetical protein [Streptomyces sp. HC307]